MTSTVPLTGPPGSRVELDLVWVLDRRHGRPLSSQPDEVLAERLQRAQRSRARDVAEEADLILAFAGLRPASEDPPAGSRGARRPGWTPEPAAGDVSEFFTAELAAVLNVGRGTAAHKLARALTWRDKLPRTFAALKAGDLDERRATALADGVEHVPADVAGRVEDALLREASDLSVFRVKNRITELVLAFDAAAAEDARKEAAKTADVHLCPSAVNGRCTVAADLPADEAVECFDVVDHLATMLKADGDDRPIGELRAHVLSLLIRRPGDPGLPSVCANVTITAALEALEGVSAAPGEVGGLPITAAHLRDLLARVGALGLTAPDGGELTFAVTGPDGQLLATLTPAQLARLARRGCPAHPDATCRCPVTGPPPRTDAYEPTDRQRAFVTTRDRRCRFPNCGQRVGWADLDHVVSHACGGATDCANLCCLCRSHHRLKTFAPGWRFAMDPDGTLRVTTPSGVTRTTRPPGLQLAPAEDPRQPEPPGSPPGAPADDPPPF